MIAEIIKEAESKNLALDDSFEFACGECGQCCKMRLDIKLSGVDMYYIAKHLDCSVRNFFCLYCATGISEETRVPVVLLKSNEHNGMCVLAEDNLCGVQEDKPFVCRTFPLGYNYNNVEGFSYYMQEGIRERFACKFEDAEQQSVKDWLGVSGDAERLEVFGKWIETQMMARRAITFFESNGYTDEIVQSLWNAILFYQHIGFDTGWDLLPQIERNKNNLALLFDETETHKKKARIHPIIGRTVYANA
jgi:hypothetical protein